MGLMIDGRRYAETFVTRGQAEDWELVTRARAVTGSLPGRATVAKYAARLTVRGLDRETAYEGDGVLEFSVPPP